MHRANIRRNLAVSNFFSGITDVRTIPRDESRKRCSRWGSVNDFYLLPGGCGIFGANLNSQGFPKSGPALDLHRWLAHDALHWASLPLVDRTTSGETGMATLQGQVENIFPFR